MFALPRRGRLFAIGLSAAAVAGAALADEPVVYEQMRTAGGQFDLSWDDALLDAMQLRGHGAIEGATLGSEAPVNFSFVENEVQRINGGTFRIAADLSIESDSAKRPLSELAIVGTSHPELAWDFMIYDETTGRPALTITGSQLDLDRESMVLIVSSGDLRMTEHFAGELGRPELADAIVGTVRMQLALVSEQFTYDLIPESTVLTPANGDSDGITSRAGGDVVLREVQSISNHGAFGNIYGYSIGSNTCNIGDANILWTNNGTPGLAMNAYMIRGGRMIQLGQSWVKHACCAGATNGCGLSCNGQGGSVLGAGCLDVYSSSWNAGQGRLGPRAGINAWSGAFSALPGGSGNAIFRRIQIPRDKMGTAGGPFGDALYFVEGVYVGTQDSQFNNRNNNANHKRVTMNSSFQMSLTGTAQSDNPAIKAWRANGLGLGVVDARVVDGVLDVPGEGRFHYATKVTDLGGGRWLYDYAIYNLSSDRSGGSLVVPTGMHSASSAAGFNDVDYHSGEPYDNTDWTILDKSHNVTWSSPQTSDQNANSNALRWGTMYNFWFESNRPPTSRVITLGLFKPGTPTEVTFVGAAPEAPGDRDHDGDVDLTDLSMLIANFGCAAGCTSDIDGDGDTDISDLAIQLSNFGAQ